MRVRMHVPILATPTYVLERSKFKLLQRSVLNVASELESRLSTEFLDKISFWLSFKLSFNSS